MRRAFLIILFAIFSLELVAQNKSLIVGVKLTPEIAAWSSTYRPGDYQPRLSLGGGIHLIKPVTSALSIESGVYVINRGWQSDIELIDQHQVPQGVFNEKVNYVYFGFPILLRVNFKSFYASAGPSVELQVLHYSNRQDDLRIEKDKVNWSFPIALGYTKHLSDRLSFLIEARVNPTLNNVNPPAPAKAYSKNFGFGLGMNYALK